MKILQNLKRTIACAGLLWVSAAAIIAQKPVHPGVLLYQQGRIDQAIVALEFATKTKEYKSDPEIWNTLGLSYFEKDDLKQANKAIERAIKLAPNVAAYHSNNAYILLLSRRLGDARSESQKAIQLDPRNTNAQFVLGRANLWDDKLDEAEQNAIRMIEIDPALPDGYILRSNTVMARLGKKVAAGWDVSDEIDLLKQALDILAEGAVKCRSNPKHKSIDDEAEAVKAFYDHYSKEKQDDPSATGMTPLRIVQKPKPSYTDAARRMGVSGTVKMAVIFGADGNVRYALLLNRLGFGLDEMAVQAARSIRFVPQMKDGRPVSVVRTVEYSFLVY